VEKIAAKKPESLNQVCGCDSSYGWTRFGGVIENTGARKGLFLYGG